MEISSTFLLGNQTTESQNFTLIYQPLSFINVNTWNKKIKLRKLPSNRRIYLKNSEALRVSLICFPTFSFTSLESGSFCFPKAIHLSTISLRDSSRFIKI